MSSNSSNDVSIFVGILAGVAVMLVVGVIGLIGAGFFMFRATARSIPVPTIGSPADGGRGGCLDLLWNIHAFKGAVVELCQLVPDNDCSLRGRRS